MLANPELMITQLEFGSGEAMEVARRAFKVIQNRLAKQGVKDPLVVEYLLWNHPKTVRVDIEDLPRGYGGLYDPVSKNVMVNSALKNPEVAMAHEFWHAAQDLVKRHMEQFPGIALGERTQLMYQLAGRGSHVPAEHGPFWAQGSPDAQVVNPTAFQKAVQDWFSKSVWAK